MYIKLIMSGNLGDALYYYCSFCSIDIYDENGSKIPLSSADVILSDYTSRNTSSDKDTWFNGIYGTPKASPYIDSGNLNQTATVIINLGSEIYSLSKIVLESYSNIGGAKYIDIYYSKDNIDYIYSGKITFSNTLQKIEYLNKISTIDFKYLINQNSKYYSIKSNFYELGAPIDNTTLEKWYDKYGADDLSSITASLTTREMPMTLDNATGIWKTDFSLDANLVETSVEMLNIATDNKVIKYGSPTYRIYDDYLVPEFNINMLKK